MKILVTGATGFIGRRLVPALSKEHEVFALTRKSSDLSGPFETGEWPRAVDGIIHLAQANVALPEGASELFMVNTLSTQRLLEYGCAAGASCFILASTGDVYGERPGKFQETDAAQPRSLYEISKYGAEALVQAYAGKLRTCIVRLFHPYGPGQSHRLIPRMIESIRLGKTITLHAEGRPYVTPLFITDVVLALERLLHSSFQGIVNVAGDEAVSIRQLAEIIGKQLGKQPVFRERGETRGDLVGDNTKMKKTLGISSLVRLSEGIQKVLDAEEKVLCQSGS